MYSPTSGVRQCCQLHGRHAVVLPFLHGEDLVEVHVPYQEVWRVQWTELYVRYSIATAVCVYVHHIERFQISLGCQFRIETHITRSLLGSTNLHVDHVFFLNCVLRPTKINVMLYIYACA